MRHMRHMTNSLFSVTLPTRVCAWAVLVWIAFSTLTTHAHAMTIVHMSDQQLVEASTLIVRGKVIKKHSMWIGQKTTIVTQVTISVYEEVLGRTAPATVTIRHYGGTVGDFSMGLEHAPHFAQNEEVVVFLHTNKYIPNEYLLTGWTQGKWTVNRPESTTPTSSTDLPVTIHRVQTPSRIIVPKTLTLQTNTKQTNIARQEDYKTFVTRLKTYWTTLQKKRTLKLTPTPNKQSIKPSSKGAN
ncbi:MAG TPA: hypothetical protein DCE42_27000 [Myxococcales bacterium]|nr:hypothetical protein [Deltaproteobacteria bacterium]MBU49446.1 hypothetical protein [Deltaproteobacteria bacterium]HAA58441.1 hypothetical protein [Myxococcales bacterium]